MNTRTTFLLFTLLVVAVGTYALLMRQQETKQAAVEAQPAPAVEPAGITRDLFSPKPGEADRVVVKRRDQDEWVFDRDESAGGTMAPQWRMTSPIQTPVTGFEIDRIARQISNLRYTISFKAGTPDAVTPDQAGLAPPELVVTVTDATATSYAVEIGRPRADSETYVRVAGTDTIVVAEANLKNLVKPRAVEYRDLQLWNFAAEKATRVELDDRSQAESPVHYVFVKDGARWMMQEPVAARATSKIDDMLRTMNRLRAMKWEEDRAERLAAYGLDPAAQTIRVTVVEEVAKENENQDEKEGEPEKESRTTVYELHLSTQSPIGDESRVYFRAGSDPFVGTLVRVNADKFKPVMSEWRDMHVTPAAVNEATRIELNIEGDAATLVKTAGRWKFEADGSPAEDSVVRAMLKSLADLTAVSFTDGEPTDPGALGMVNPRAEIRLTIPGAEQVERITVGGPTDAASKRLVYVRRNDVASVAKVRAAELASLTQAPSAYRDRTIFDIHPDRFDRLELETRNPEIAADAHVTLEKSDSLWTMVAPVAAPIRSDRIGQLVSALSTLRAEAIVADDGDAAAYGLDQPTARVRFTYRPPVQYRVEPAETAEPENDDDQEEGEAAKAERMVTREVQPPPETLELLFSHRNGKHYARRADRPTIYQVHPDVYQKLSQEFRTHEVMGFDDTKVTRFEFRSEDGAHTFEKRNGTWVYVPEPDLPLDSTKVTNLLLQLKDIRTERYVRHETEALSEFGLDRPAREANVRLDDGSEMTLLISGSSPARGVEKGNFATVKDRKGVFLLAPDTITRLTVVLPDLEAARRP
jgi:hypothetical protein